MDTLLPPPYLIGVLTYITTGPEKIEDPVVHECTASEGVWL
jgi:hypothetical protein